MNTTSQKLRLATTILLPLTALLIAYTLYLVFLVVPNERIMGPVQRIFYFHVGSAIAAYVASALVCLGSIGFLATKKAVFDLLAEAASEVGFILCSMVLVSGMIWAHSAWNTWFSWEPRLVSFLLMWLIYLSFVLLRAFGDKTRTPTQCAVLGIVGVVMVPLVIFSVKLLPQVAQMHPQVVENRGLKDTRFVEAMLLGMVTMVALQSLLVVIRMRIGTISRELTDERIS